MGKWIERVPGLRLDGERPTSKALAGRLAGFWIPSQAVLYIASSATGVGGRVAALDQHVLGDRRPHAAGQWLRTLRLEGARVWWAETAAPEEYEDALLAAFADAVTPEERAALFDPSVVLPFANLRTVTGERKGHGITGAVLPDDRAPDQPIGRVVEVPPGDADGAVAPHAGGGGIRPPRAPRTSPRPAPAAARSSPRAAAASTRRVGSAGRADPGSGELSADGHARLNAELDELVRVRRPEVVARIRAAKELGDLKENADYTAAREEQSFLEGRIQAIEARLRSAVVVDRGGESTIGLGSRVTVETGGDELQLTIVGMSESDPSNGRVSTMSPVGKALLGKAVGETTVVRTPRGDVEYRVIAIE